MEEIVDYLSSSINLKSAKYTNIVEMLQKMFIDIKELNIDKNIYNSIYISYNDGNFEFSVDLSITKNIINDINDFVNYAKLFSYIQSKLKSKLVKYQQYMSHPISNIYELPDKIIIYHNYHCIIIKNMIDYREYTVRNYEEINKILCEICTSEYIKIGMYTKSAKN